METWKDFESGIVKAIFFLWTHTEGGLAGERLTVGRNLGGYCNGLGEKKNCNYGADSGKNGRNVEYTKDRVNRKTVVLHHEHLIDAN